MSRYFRWEDNKTHRKNGRLLICIHIVMSHLVLSSPIVARCHSQTQSFQCHICLSGTIWCPVLFVNLSKHCVCFFHLSSSHLSSFPFSPASAICRPFLSIFHVHPCSLFLLAARLCSCIFLSCLPHSLLSASSSCSKSSSVTADLHYVLAPFPCSTYSTMALVISLANKHFSWLVLTVILAHNGLCTVPLQRTKSQYVSIMGSIRCFALPGIIVPPSDTHCSMRLLHRQNRQLPLITVRYPKYSTSLRAEESAYF